MKLNSIFNHPFFSLGFRPFFSLAGLAALILIALWLLILKGLIMPDLYFPNNLWHAHEMLLGYTLAVISGFLLTAVQNWTGQETVKGAQLAGLCMLWSAGRIAPFCLGILPDALIAMIDLSYIPCLVYHLIKPILKAKQYKNMVFIGLLSLLMLGNVLIHAELLNLTQNSSSTGIMLILATLLVMISIIAIRVFPFFTERAIPGTKIIKRPILEGLMIVSTLSVFGLQYYEAAEDDLALAAFFAALIHGERLSAWYTKGVASIPLLWVLYLGYGWIVLGFILTIPMAYDAISFSLTLHVFTVGAISVLTLGMMARVSLGHTGRMLKVSNWMVVAFISINLSAMIRVLLPILFFNEYALLIDTAAFFWGVAFLIFCFVYIPILTRARVDA